MKIDKAPVPSTKFAPSSFMRKVVPNFDCDVKKCEVRLNIGLFFDGTNNNKDQDAKHFSDSNIARLYDLYNSRGELGYNRIYIPGVGTKFPGIGDYEESMLGAGCAFGCEARVIFALLSTINCISRKCTEKDVFNENSILALCRNDASLDYKRDSEHLTKFHVKGGLLRSSMGNSSDRHTFLRQQCNILEKQIRDKKPRIVECFVDVFGFSRGAAEARVFCTWLNELLLDGYLAGVPLRFRFVGIMDTVASAGFWSGTTALITNSTGGHGAWASAEALRIPAAVHNCVHMVAMHELRRNFPLDAIGINGKLQEGWVQYAYPGSHSDVGGGYRPGELGISTGCDSLKLSQIPLNHMLDCAIAAGAPLRRRPPVLGDYNAFAIHPELLKAFEDFISESAISPRPMYEWLQPYLNWRWQMREKFHTTNQVRYASSAERAVLNAFNTSLIYDAGVIDRANKPAKKIRYKFIAIRGYFEPGIETDIARSKLLDPEAGSVLELAKKSKSTPLALAVLFDRFVHDSLAGFNSPNLERPGYWRYRKVFLGTDEHVIAVNQGDDETRSAA